MTEPKASQAVDIVLVRPEHPVNVGAAARCIRNMGLRALRLVTPGDWRTIECWRTAWGAHEVLEQATVFDDLAAALEGVAYVAAFSGKRDPHAPPLDVREMAEEVAALGTEERAALVFGPETSGLTRAEIALCGRRVRIPAHPGQPSLNLSHAVVIGAYEIYRTARREGSGRHLATHDEKQHLLGLLREGLGRIQALPSNNTEGYFREWQALFQRTDLTRRELTLLEHMARKMTKTGSPPLPGGE
jgi:TrmH family RNA methyltransferase